MLNAELPQWEHSEKKLQRENWRHCLYVSGSKYDIHPKFYYISKET